MKTLEKTIDIHAPKEKVWDVLTEDKYTPEWYVAFSEGAHAIADWKLNRRAGKLRTFQSRKRNPFIHFNRSYGRIC